MAPPGKIWKGENKMKKLISGILCTALIATCFCGCSREESGTSGDKKHNSSKEIFNTQKNEDRDFYLLKEFTEKNDAGEVLCRETYEYNEAGLVTAQLIDDSESETVYNEELWIYEYVTLPCDGNIDRENHFSYDSHGNITEAKGLLYDDEIREYTYDQSGKVTGVECYYLWDGVKRSGGQYTLQYETDGRIELWFEKDGQDQKTWEWQTDEGQVKNFQRNSIEGFEECVYEYDSKGNLIGFNHTLNDEPYTKGTRSYDNQGRVTKEKWPGYDEFTYQYDENRLVSINGVELTYREKSNGELVVTAENYELTYEPVKLTKDEIVQARRKWNLLCGAYSNKDPFIDFEFFGIPAPGYDANTELLLPKRLFG